MRILMVNYEYPPLGGGGGIAHQDIAEALCQRHRVCVLTTQYRGLPHVENRRGVQIHRIPVVGRVHLPTATLLSMVTFTPMAFLNGMRVLRTFRPDLIHAFFAVPSGVPALWLSRWAGIPLVLTLIGGDVYDPDPTVGIASHRNPLVRAVVRQVIRSADALTAISHDTRRRALAYHHGVRDISVIPLGFVPPVIPDQSSAVRSRGGGARLITVGRLIPRKAHLDLLAALAALEKKDVTLDVIGDGPLRSDLVEAARDYKISDRVTFHGRVSEQRKWTLLMAADCFVSASRYEGFGIVFLEAMYAGLPIVSTDVGGQTDFLDRNVNALFVPPQDVPQLVKALTNVLRDAQLRARMTEANRAKVKKFFIEDVAARYELVLQHTLTHSRTA